MQYGETGAVGSNKTAGTARGFTLVEVMVALLIVSVGISAILFQMMGNTSNMYYLREKAYAQWVAGNQLTLARIANRQSNALLKDTTSGVETLAGRSWYWSITPQRTGVDGFVQLTVVVRPDNPDNASIVTLLGFIDAFHTQ